MLPQHFQRSDQERFPEPVVHCQRRLVLKSPNVFVSHPSDYEFYAINYTKQCRKGTDQFPRGLPSSVFFLKLSSSQKVDAPLAEIPNDGHGFSQAQNATLFTDLVQGLLAAFCGSCVASGCLVQIRMVAPCFTQKGMFLSTIKL